jgi:hypothetical protein
VSAGLRHAEAMLARTRGFSRGERRVLLDLLDRRRGDRGWDAGGSVLAELGHREFDWPEFDRWQRFFAAWGARPPMWDGLTAAPLPRAAPDVVLAYRERKLFLLLDWLRGLAARPETRAVVARYARLGVPARVVRQDGRAPCPACERRDRREVGDSSSELPPFHPGCRCLVLPALPARRDIGGRLDDLSLRISSRGRTAPSKPPPGGATPTGP